MLVNTTWAPNKELREAFLNRLSKLEKEYADVNNALSSNLYPINRNTYHFIVNLLKPENRLERALCSCIFNIAYQAEILSQGAGPASFLYAIGFSKSLLGNVGNEANMQKLVEGYQQRAVLLKEVLESQSKPITKKLLKEFLQDICQGDSVLAETVWQALELAGLEGKVFVENGKQPNYVVSATTGYNFRINPYKFLLDSNGSWERSKCRLLIVDGLIEKVSEIDHILHKLYETKEPFAFVAHGFSEEVIATLKANQERKNFDALAVRIPSDIEALNMMNDIAVVSGTSPISSLKGELLCFVKYEELPVVDSLHCNAKELNIQNTSSASAVNEHIKHLLSKRNENFAVEDIQNIIDRRLKSLVSSTVTIHLKDMPIFGFDAARVKIDNSLRAAKSLLGYGTVNLDDFVRRTEAILSDDSTDVLLNTAILAGIRAISNNRTGSEYSALSLGAALLLPGKTLLNVLCSGGMVYLDLK